MTFNEYLSKLDSIKTVKFIFSIKTKKEGEESSASASIFINGDDTQETVLRVYSMGFLVSEIRLSGGKIITEGKDLPPEKAYLLMEALRSCLLWWRMEEREVEERDKLIIIRNSWRKVYIDQYYIPLSQEIYLSQISKVVINYEKPEFYPYNSKEEGKGIWFPSLVTVKFQDNEIGLHIEKIVMP